MELIRAKKRRKRVKLEKMDPKYVRFTLDKHLDQFNKTDEHSNDVIDGIYGNWREAVDREIDQVDDLFLAQAAKEAKAASEIELSNLLYEKELVEKQIEAKREVAEFLESTKREFYQ